MGGITTTINKVKYIGIAALTIAILSVLTLNIISSYSSSKIESNAIDSNSKPSTLANDSSICDPTNTNAAACISMSITSHSATGDSDNANLSLSIPQGGGLVAGRHTVKVVTNSVSGATLDLYTTDSTNLTSTDNQNLTIPSIGSNSNYYFYDGVTSPLSDGYWGVAIPGSAYANQFGNIYNGADVYEQYVTNPGPIRDTGTYAGISPKFAGIIRANQNGQGSDVDTTIEMWSDAGAHIQDIYYGVMIDDPASFPAGDYSTSVVYTATVNLPPTPTNLSVSPTTFEFDSCNDSLITIEGTDLSSVYEVYLQKSGATDESNRLECTNLNVESSIKLTCNIPTSRDEVELNTTYDIYVISQAANPGVLRNAFTYTEPATGISVKSTSENIIVDYDANLIPVIYVGYDGNGGGHWESLTKSEITSNTDNWFNYTNKQWANAVTVTKDSLSKYQDKHATIDNNDVLGYWVYIPRYAYEVQRRDAVDKVVDPQNFDIVFQTADQKNTPAPTKSTTTNHLDYRNSGISRTYVANSNNTTWATNPAFTWGGTELNGIWVGKYETTGKISAPTVKPNQHANVNEYIGNFYLAAKSIGKEDKCNVGGGSTTERPTLEDDLVPNSHNLATTKSHMLKNSEWGAITYLAHSKYGAGINTSYTRKSNVSKNGAYLASGSQDADGDPSTYSPTGCGPVGVDSTGSYNTNTVLDADTIESDLVCGSTQRAYNGSLGVLSSTTNNGSSDTGQGVYGVYGLSGGVSEYVMGNRTTNAAQTTATSTDYFSSPAKSPYVDLYVATSNGPFGTKPSWSSAKDSEEYWYNYDVCTFETCGGTATYETTTVQSVSSITRSWGGTYSGFVDSSGPWFYRGGYSYDSYAGPFYANSYNGNYNVYYGSRAALLALPAGQ